MTRPIDADALIEAMTKFSNAIGEDMTHGIFYAHIAPTIDAVPVIRCKDCEDCMKTKLFDGTRWNYCTRLRCVVTDDDFCCWAERKYPKIKAKETE